MKVTALLALPFSLALGFPAHADSLRSPVFGQLGDDDFSVEPSAGTFDFSARTKNCALKHLTRSFGFTDWTSEGTSWRRNQNFDVVGRTDFTAYAKQRYGAPQASQDGLSELTPFDVMLDVSYTNNSYYNNRNNSPATYTTVVGGTTGDFLVDGTHLPVAPLEIRYRYSENASSKADVLLVAEVPRLVGVLKRTCVELPPDDLGRVGRSCTKAVSELYVVHAGSSGQVPYRNAATNQPTRFTFDSASMGDCLASN
jgi:hypothetical protein